MIRALALALVLVGCYRNDVPTGELACSSDGRCPQGYRCLAGRCWTPGTGPDLSVTADLASPPRDLAAGDLAARDLAMPDLGAQDFAMATTQDFAMATTQDFAMATTQDFAMATTQDFAMATTQDFAMATQDLTVLIVDPPVLANSVPTSPSNTSTPTVTGTSAPNATITFYLGSCGTTILTTATANGSGDFSQTVPVAVDANNNIVATATVGGITSSCSSPLAYVEDETKPGTPGNVHASGGNRSVLVTWNPASDDRSGVGSYEVTCTGTGCPPTITGINGLSTTVNVGTNCGSYSFKVSARDQAGNLGIASLDALATTVLPSPSPVAYVTGPSIVEYSFPAVPNATDYVVCHAPTGSACAGTSSSTGNHTSGWLFGVTSDGPTAGVNLAVIAKDGAACSSSPTPDSTQNVPSHRSKYTSDGPNAGMQLGMSVTMLGDLDGDGFPEYLAGAPTPLGTPSMESAYVFSTLNSGAEICHVTGLLGGTVRNHDYFGWGVAGGDVNGDGKPDLIVGAPLFGDNFADPSPQFNRGEIWLFDGTNCTSPGSPPNPFRQKAGAGGDKLGWSVAYLGDLDGDGKGEYAAGAPGAKYVSVFKGSDGSAFYANITNAAIGFGTSLAAVGDLDQDGYSDLVVGAPDANSNQGAVLAYSGKTGNPINSTINGASGDKLGSSVAGVGDVNGDGVPDFAAAGSGNHVVHVYSGASFQVLWTESGDYVAAMGDLDRDGRADFAVGTSGVSSGSVTMYSGFDGNALYGFGVGPQISALAFGGHLEDGNIVGLLVGEATNNPGGHTNAGSVQAFVANNFMLEISHGEWIDPFGFGGYGGGGTPSVAPSGGKFFSYYGGTGPASFSLATNGSSAFLSGPSDGPTYHAGAVTPRFDLLRVTDALNRTLDTRVLAADAIAPSPSPQPRPAPLDANPFSSTRIDLLWLDSGSASSFTVEVWQATQAWVRFVDNTPSCTAGSCGVDVTGLQPNTNYAFRVQAILAATGGMSLWSRTVYASTPP